MSFEILNRYTQAVLFSSATATDLPSAIREAAASGADLSGADLSGADLYGANLSGADLSRADLSRADLSRANLSRANLYGANLSRANLYGANLYGANLYGANLYGANLYGAEGLLNGVKPLQISGSQHALIVRSPGFITIGCEHHEVAWWEEHYAAIGRSNDYTDAQVLEYRKHIQYAKEWMEALGVDKVEVQATTEATQ